MKYTGERVYIRSFELTDAEEKLAMLIKNKDFFQLYSPTKNEDYYTLEVQKTGIQNLIKEQEEGQRYGFGIFSKDTDALIGSVTLSWIARGALQSCYIGYELDQAQNGKGYMTEAVKLTVDFAFQELQLHRIEAGVMPRNIGSIRVLEKAGFHKEGIAIENVKINGKWEDHQILAIINRQ